MIEHQFWMTEFILNPYLHSSIDNHQVKWQHVTLQYQLWGLVIVNLTQYPCIEKKDCSINSCLEFSRDTSILSYRDNFLFAFLSINEYIYAIFDTIEFFCWRWPCGMWESQEREVIVSQHTQKQKNSTERNKKYIGQSRYNGSPVVVTLNDKKCACWAVVTVHQ